MVITAAPHEIATVKGRYSLDESRTILSINKGNIAYHRQMWVSEARETRYCGAKAYMTVKIRNDDECGNGHNSFSITAEISNRSEILAGGCLHDEIKEVFPELAFLIQYHLYDTDNGPMHGVANAVYHASDRDYNGKRKGEPYAFKHNLHINDDPIGHEISSGLAEFIEAHKKGDEIGIVGFSHTDIYNKTSHKYSFAGMKEGYNYAPFASIYEAEKYKMVLENMKYTVLHTPFLVSEGKERDLNAARVSCNWPDAPDEILLLPSDELRKILEARIPAQIADFKAAVESIGFKF